MKFITYKFCDGTTSNVEVSDEMYASYISMVKAEALTERKETRRHQSLDKSMDSGWDIVDPNADVESIFETLALNKALYRALESLSPAHRELIKKVFFDRVPQVQIADQEGVSSVAIHRRLQRILLRLRKILGSAR